MAKNTNVSIGLICPPAWGSAAFEGQPQEAPYWLKILPIHANGHNHFHWYRGLDRAMAEFAPHIVNIEEEHYSVVTAQVLRRTLALGAKAVFYTWQNIHKTYPPPFRWLERYVLQHAAAAVAGNSEAMDILRAKGFQRPIAVIPQMGVDLERFIPKPERRTLRQELGLTVDAVWFAYVGRLVPEKGLVDLLQAFAKLPGHTRLLMLGAGPEQQALRQLATELALGDRLLLVDAVPSQRVPAWLAAMDALCLPSHTQSNWKEQFGRVLVEAMAAGVIPIGSSSGEIPKVIAEAGLVHRERDVDDLQRAMLQVVNLQPQARARLQDLGLKRVEAHFTNDRIADKLLQFLLANA